MKHINEKSKKKLGTKNSFLGKEILTSTEMRVPSDGGFMDTNEIIALTIVAVAALLVIRHYRKDKGSCCGGDCSKMIKGKGEEKK